MLCVGIVNQCAILCIDLSYIIPYYNYSMIQQLIYNYMIHFVILTCDIDFYLFRGINFRVEY